MKTTTFAAASVIFAAVALAQPHARLHAKRAVTYTTVIEEVVVTVDVTTTIYVDATSTSAPPAVTGPTSTEQPDIDDASVENQPMEEGAQFYAQPAPVVNPEPAPTPVTANSEPPAATSSQAAVYEAVPPASSSPPPPPPAEPAPTESASIEAAPAVPAPAESAPAQVPPASAPEEYSASSQGGAGGVCSSESNTCGGDLTTYEVGVGSCGIKNSGSEDVVALAANMMKAVDTGNPNNNPYCGRSIMIQYHGKQHAAKIVDTCPGCADGGLDLSDKLYQFFQFDGRAHGMTWFFTD